MASTQQSVIASPRIERLRDFVVTFSNLVERASCEPDILREGSHLLKEAISQKIEGKRLEIHGVFTDGPFSVKVVETMIENAPAGPLRLPIPGAVEDVVVIDVRP